MNGVTATAIFRPRSDLGRFVEANVTPGVRAGVEQICAFIEAREKELAAVDTGEMRDSIRTEIEETGKTIVGRVGPHTDHDIFVEYGTGIRGAASAGAGEGPYNPNWMGMPAQPFCRPALDEARTKAVDIMAHNVGMGLK